MHELSKKNLIHRDRITVSLKTIGELIDSVTVFRRDVIRPIEEPWLSRGSIVILNGNLALKRGTIKISALSEDLYFFKGITKVFNSEEEAVSAIMNGKIEKGMLL